MSQLPISHSSSAGNPHGLGLRVVASFKFLESLCFLAAAALAFGLGQPARLGLVLHWLQGQSIVGTKLGHDVVDLLSSLGPARFTALGLIALAYALLFCVEGIGLWMRKYWAEWLTVFATGSLVPYEGYELWHRFGWIKLAILLINIAIVLYLIRVALHARHERRNG